MGRSTLITVAPHVREAQGGAWPGGDLCRQLYISDLQIDGDSTLFHTINRNKRSYAADLKTPGLGLYRASYEVFKDDGALVLYCEHLQTVKYRDPRSAKT